MPTHCTNCQGGPTVNVYPSPILREEFVAGMLEHPVTSKILRIKKIDAILDTM